MPTRSFASPADLADCKARLRTGSRSFHTASKLLPARVCGPAGVLYAFCRLADDAIDDAVDGRSEEHGTEADLALARLRGRLDRAYAGRPIDHPVDRALAVMLEQTGMPRALPDALLEGFAWDAAARRYDTLSDVLAYGARVAGSVGAMMAVLMHRRSMASLARACDLGVAMQLSNIARDVGEDARAGRLYLPRDWMVEAGLDPCAFLANPVFSPQLAQVVQRLLAVADALYARADAGIASLPLTCRPGIGAARRIYAEIGHEVARAGFDSLSRRAVVSSGRKLALLGASVAGAMLPGSACDAPPLEETRFLVEAASVPEIRTTGRVAWAMELFARLDDRDMARSAALRS
jgi:phytoene synthase